MNDYVILAVLLVLVGSIALLGVVVLVSLRTIRDMGIRNGAQVERVVRVLGEEMGGNLVKSAEQMTLAVKHIADAAFDVKVKGEDGNGMVVQVDDPTSQLWGDLADDREWTDHDFPMTERPMVMGVRPSEGIVGPSNDINLSGEEYNGI